MITRIYFVRHAQVDINIKEDSIRPLSNKGKVDALKLPKFFSNFPIDKVVSSPYKRAVETVQPIADECGLEVELMDGFKERKISGGGWIEDFTGFSKNQWDDFDYKLEGGESLKEVQNRNVKALKNLLIENEGMTIIVGTHGTALSTIINHYNQSFNGESFNRIKGIMPWIVKFTFEDENNEPKINFMNESLK